ncbi:MAG: amidase [Oscillochloris sp.]|nr:amidase [Oscillochloris sp.]
MSELIERLRANLRAAGIPAIDDDFAGIVEMGFLSRVADFARIVDAAPADTLPDYLDAGNLPAPTLATAPAGPPAAAPEDTIAGIAVQIRSRAVSPVELTAQALAQIAARDGELNAFQVVLADAARAEAQAAEKALAAGTYHGPLHGVPLAVKDLLDLAGTRTRAGSSFHGPLNASQDATAVAKLRTAGAVIVGKTRLSEFAYSPGSNNAHYGATANPHDLSRDTGGSSSGSAAATAAGMAFAALGTDTGCSIRIPAAFCGLVGLKPTWGRTSLAGGVTLSWSLDHLGPIARSVADAALLLEVLAGPDLRDGRTLRPAPAFIAGDLTAGVQGLRIAIISADGSGAPLAAEAQRAAVGKAAAALQSAGAEVSELEIPELDQLRVLGSAILGMEAAAFHLPTLRTRLDDYGSFMRRRVLANFVYQPVDFIRAQQARAVLRRRMLERCAGIDLLIGPIHPGPVPARGVPANNGLAIPFNNLGWPALTMPAVKGEDGLPIAVQIAGKPWQEQTVLRAAYVVEQALGRMPLV